jgi:hypothetical protein
VSGRQARKIRRAVSREIAAREPQLDALFASKLRPKPWWLPGFVWRAVLRLVLREPPPQPDYGLINRAVHLLRTAGRRR